MPAKAVEKSTAAETKVAAASAGKKRELDAAISSITKAFGDGAIMRLGDAHAQQKIEIIPTGALSLDLALGVGGVPRGRVVEIYGP
ncbi:MAG TPA: DNA recombination/repair protein RecA, partial [Verrucomicrobiae bacterium]|nr:DNA recombination/repair protein RecA [Verrucomicrobiae bacterium]